ncbi:MAG TPA: sensor histidine kinase [Acidobacteriota bacterium]|nr:sensor histidine kinase [Acidobacteriota bacterium]
MNKTDPFHSLHEISLSLFVQRVYEQLRLISEERMSVREDERRKIAREIHDEFGQVLLALKLEVSILNKKLLEEKGIVSNVNVKKEIQGICQMIDNAIETVHRVIAELRPETLNHLGLRGAIEWQAHEFQARTGIPVEIRADPETITVSDPTCATTLFRIFQEALFNVGKHARASRVETTIRETNEFLSLQIKDNGRGISESDLLKTSSFGILGLKERVFLINGDVEIKGIPDQGTTVTVRIPLQLFNSQQIKGGSEEST